VKKNQILFIVLLLIGAAFVITVYKGGAKKEIAVGLPAPDFLVTDIVNGQRISSAELKGKVLFVNFWASWCEPCKEEMPSLESLYREVMSQKDFRMVTILYRDSPSNALGYMKVNGYTFPVYTDMRESSSKDFGVTGVPETYIVDKKGILRRRVIGGADWNSPDEKGLINSLLNE
jgi:cytochrome c biogenesis protein CcmG/thiol:disulfide interchange protein DsbE